MELFSMDVLEEFENFLNRHEKGHFLQSYYWSKVKSNWNWNAIIKRNENGEIIGTLSYLIKKIPFFPYKLMYASRGPVCDLTDEKTITSLIEDAKKVAKAERCYKLKLDPDVLVDDGSFAEMMKNQGFEINKNTKAYETIQPRFVFRLNIKDKTEDELLASFHHKTRYNIRLAAKKGVVVRIEGKEKLNDFIKIMKTTGERDDFAIRNISYFEKMADALKGHFRLYMAYFEDKPIAGAVAIHYSNKVWYLYGGSLNVHRNMMPNYLLQFEMIKWAVQNNCSLYDFRGVSGFEDENHPMYGVYRFKKGFNPTFTEFIGELNLVFNPFIDFLVNKSFNLLKLFRSIFK